MPRLTWNDKLTILVMTERATRYEIAISLRDQTAASVVDALDKLEAQYGNKFASIFKTFTVDNGAEFMDVDGIERSALSPDMSRTHVYYCHPRFPGERGSNEKQNQIVRWFFPKGTDFGAVPGKQLKAALDWINNYPRLLLDWRSSGELFSQFIAAL